MSKPPTYTLLPLELFLDHSVLFTIDVKIWGAVSLILMHWYMDDSLELPRDRELQWCTGMSDYMWKKYKKDIYTAINELIPEFLEYKKFQQENYRKKIQALEIAKPKYKQWLSHKRLEHSRKQSSLSHNKTHAPIIPPLSPLEEKNSRDIYPIAHSQPIPPPEPLTILEMLRRGMYNNPPKQNSTKPKSSTWMLTD
jgi:hypothetical protein